MRRSFVTRLRSRMARFIEPAAERGAAGRLARMEDGLLTEHAADFLEDPAFQRAYAAGKATGSWWSHDLRWRAYVVCWAAMHGRSLPGDFVECGVHRGGYARMLAEYVDLNALPDKKMYLVDTFAGIPNRYAGDPAAALFDGIYEDNYEQVRQTFVPFENAVLVRGAIPEILGEVTPERVCFLSIDLNAAEPSVAAAEHFWPRMSQGAAIVFDDYNFKVFAGQKKALDAFAERAGANILAMPTGQGLLIKS